MALEHLVQYAESLKASKDGQDIDVFLFGHRHAPIDTPIAGGQARYLNLGDWITHHTSVCLQGGEARLIHHQI
jgi:UDP-2,3-diacylglucosamine hydrolase